MQHHLQNATVIFRAQEKKRNKMRPPPATPSSLAERAVLLFSSRHMSAAGEGDPASIGLSLDYTKTHSLTCNTNETE